MKKFILVVLMLLVSQFSLAESHQGAYVQADLGYSNLKLKSDGSVFKEIKPQGFAQGLSVGYDFGNDTRVAVDYTHHANENFEYTLNPTNAMGNVPNNNSVDVSTSGRFTSNSVGLTAIMDLDTQTNIKPYFGVRVSANRLRIKGSHVVNDGNGGQTIVGRYSKRKIRPGIGFILGVGVKLTDNVDVDLSYRYNFLGKINGKKLSSHEGMAGLRYRF